MKIDHELRNAGYSQEEFYIYTLECEQKKEAIEEKPQEKPPAASANPPKKANESKKNSEKYSPPDGLGYGIGLMF